MFRSEARRVREIDALFFSPHDYIQRGTVRAARCRMVTVVCKHMCVQPEHRDFHGFLQKYLAHAAKQPKQPAGRGDSAVCAQLGIPAGDFNRRYRVNFSILGEHHRRRQK